MTFSIIGRCQRSGMFGVAIATSSICVGARCPHVRAAVGAVASQNITDPSLGTAVLAQLETGKDARNALQSALNERGKKEYQQYRQVTVVDRHGNTACHSGKNVLGINGQVAGKDCHAAGNLLANDVVLNAMVAGFTEHKNAHLAARLLSALESGVAAGGEKGAIHSAALLVADTQPFALVDLRIDWRAHNPVGALRDLWRDYQPQMNDYLTRAIDPANAPAYGVPGE